MDSAHVPRRERSIRSARVHRASASRTREVPENRAPWFEPAEHLEAIPFATPTIAERQKDDATVPQRRPSMSASRWRWSLIGLWLALAFTTFVTINSMTARSWLLLLVVGVIPPAMMLWLWNEDRPRPLGSLRLRHKQL
jgi:hypothetical protein